MAVAMHKGVGSKRDEQRWKDRRRTRKTQGNCSEKWQNPIWNTRSGDVVVMDALPMELSGWRRQSQAAGKMGRFWSDKSKRLAQRGAPFQASIDQQCCCHQPLARGLPMLVLSVVGGRWTKAKECDALDGWTGSKERTVSINSGCREQTRSKNEWQVGEDCRGCLERKGDGQGLKLSTRHRRARVWLGFCCLH